MKFNNGLLTTLTILLETMVIVVINQYILMSNDIGSLRKVLPKMNILILILTLFAIFSIKSIENTVKKKLESNLLKDHLNHVENLLKTTQTQRHEHSRHIQTIQSMLYLGEINEAIKYIEGITQTYVHPQDFINVGHPALTALLNSKRKVAELKGIDFAFTVKCDLSEIQVEPWDLCSIIGNLIDNSLEAVIQKNGKKRVTLEIKRGKGWYVIYVNNNGPKIKESQKKLIFQPGYTTRDSKGRGYGLYLVKQLVNSYKGRIEVLSRKKTTFRIYLPCRGEHKSVSDSIQTHSQLSGTPIKKQ